MDKNTTVKVNLSAITWQDSSRNKPTSLSFDVRAIFLYDFSNSTPEQLPLADCKDIMKAYVLDEMNEAIEDFDIEIVAGIEVYRKYMLHTLTKYAVHKEGTTQFGYLCSFREEAEQMLADLKKEILRMPRDEVSKYHVVEVTLSWDE